MIRPFLPSDAPALEVLVRAFLTEHLEVGGDFLPTKDNVDFLVWRGILAARAGQPCLLATAGHVPAAVGFVLWFESACPLATRERVLTGFATYIDPIERRHGLGKHLRLAALAVAKAAGFTRVDGVGLTAAAVASGVAVGGVVRGSLVSLKVG